VVPIDMDSREFAKMYPESIKVVRIGGLCDPKEPEGDFEYAFEFRCKDGSWAYAVTDGLFNFPENSFMNWVRTVNFSFLRLFPNRNTIFHQD
jgi:hypothetical protein